MPIQAVTEAIRDLLALALHQAVNMPPNTFTVYVGPPDADNDEDELILFLMRVTPSADLRNADRVRPFALPGDPVGPPPPMRTVAPAVPLDLHYLVTAGSPQNSTAADGLRRLGVAIRAIEAASPIALPAVFQEAVWLSLEPLSTDELSRIWGLFPNFNCRTCFVFRASPVWIDPATIALPAGPVITDSAVPDHLEVA
jgi:hypothetical protein